MFIRIRFLSAFLVVATLAPAAPAAAQVADTCQVAIAAQPGVTISGDLNKNNSTSAIPAECVGETAGGPDAFYTLSMTSGYRYDILVQPASTLDVATAIWDDCTLTANPCVTGADAGGMSRAETITVEPSQDKDVVIQVVGVDAVTGATTSKSKFSLRITETQIPGDTGPVEDVVVIADDGTADISVTTDTTTGEDASISSDTARSDVAPDAGPLPDEAVSDVAAPVDTAIGQDLAGFDEEDPDGCGQGRTPAPAAIILLLAGIVLLRRRARAA